jgi:hypothetical protein
MYNLQFFDQNAGKNHNINTSNKCFERVEELKYLRKTLANQNGIQKGIKSRLKSGNACYRSVQRGITASIRM